MSVFTAIGKSKKTTKLKLPFIKEKEFISLPFGRQIEWFRKIEDWKATAKSTHLSQKRVTYTKSIREFCQLNNVTEYYCVFFNQPDYKDDSFEFWYK